MGEAETLLTLLPLPNVLRLRYSARYTYKLFLLSIAQLALHCLKLLRSD